MKAKHTPGPWQSKMNIASAAIYCPLGGLIARLPVEHEGSRNGAAHNARLIAAAPELLEAAIELKDVCNRPSAARTRAEAWRKLDKAIAKALQPNA